MIWSITKNYQEKKISYFDQKTGKSFVPYVVETSIGLDRLFLAIITASYKNEILEGGSQRVVLKIPFEISPVKAAILPLNAKDNLPEKALEIYNNFLNWFIVY